jgi:ribosomal protein S18 acetylase RimI-like enzyme
MNPRDDTQLRPVIAPLRADQIDAAIGLFQIQLEEHHIETKSERLRQVIEKIISHERHGFILAAAIDSGKLVGVTYGGAYLGLEHGGESGWLEELYVLPEYRQNGLGTRLVNEVIRLARTRGWKALDLEIDADHQRVVSLYRRHNFQLQNRSRYCLKLD